MTDDKKKRVLEEISKNLDVLDYQNSPKRLRALIDERDALCALLVESKREHHCVASGEACSMMHDPAIWEEFEGKGAPQRCTCGADEWNARVDAILSG